MLLIRAHDDPSEGQGHRCGLMRFASREQLPPSLDPAPWARVSHRSLKKQWLGLMDIVISSSVRKTPLTPCCHPLRARVSVAKIRPQRMTTRSLAGADLHRSRFHESQPPPTAIRRPPISAPCFRPLSRPSHWR